jgi:hypothetical protein
MVMEIAMERIKDMVESAFNKRDARDMLETWKIFGNMTEEEYNYGKELIKKEFDNN